MRWNTINTPLGKLTSFQQSTRIFCDSSSGAKTLHLLYCWTSRPEGVIATHPAAPGRRGDPGRPKGHTADTGQESPAQPLTGAFETAKASTSHGLLAILDNSETSHLRHSEAGGLGRHNFPSRNCPRGLTSWQHLSTRTAGAGT